MKQKKIQICLVGIIAAVSLSIMNPVSVLATSDEKSIEALESEKAEIKEKISQLESENASLESENDSLKKQVEELINGEVTEQIVSENSGNTEAVIETGSVSGNITYFYNNFKGNVSDTGTHIVLIPADGSAKNAKTIKSYVDWLIPEQVKQQFSTYNIFEEKVDGTGSYIIQRIPQGKYTMYLWSSNTTDESAFDNREAYKKQITDFLSSVLSKENAETLAEITGFYKYTIKDIEIVGNETTVFSYDFGMTYL